MTPDKPPTARLSGPLVLWSLLGAWLLTGLLMRMARVIVIESMGSGISRGEPEPQLPWLFGTEDLERALAGLPFAGLSLLVLVLCARRLLRRTTGATVPAVRLAVILGATGAFATWPSADPEAGGGRQLVGWLLAAWLVRRLPVRALGAPHRRPSSVVLAATVATGVLALVVPTAYAAFHPLTVPLHSTCAAEEDGGCVLREGRRAETRFSIANHAGRPLEIRAIRLVRAAEGIELLPWRRVPDSGYVEPLRLPVTVPSGGELALLRDVRPAAGACARLGRTQTDANGIAVADTLVVRYHVRGRTVTDRLDVSAALRIAACEGELGGFSTADL